MTDDHDQEKIDWDKTHDWSLRPGFVNRGYINDPETEELLFDGTYLRDGMRVLNGRTKNLQDLSWVGSDLCEDRAMENNRWCTISHVREERARDYHFISFFATYDDGVKIKRQHPIDNSWIVKKDSIPEDHEHNEECFEYFPGFPADLICQDVRVTNAVSAHPPMDYTKSPWEDSGKSEKEAEVPDRVKVDKSIQNMQVAVREFNKALFDLRRTLFSFYVNTTYGKMKSPEDFRKENNLTNPRDMLDFLRRAPGEEDPV